MRKLGILDWKSTFIILTFLPTFKKLGWKEVGYKI